MAEKTNKKLINVFVPTTPNPTSGFLLMFPIDDVIYLNMTFEEASKFIVYLLELLQVKLSNIIYNICSII